MNREIQFGVDYSCPETFGAEVPPGMERFWYAAFTKMRNQPERFAHEAPIDCINEDTFYLWLKKANDEFNHGNRYIYRSV